MEYLPVETLLHIFQYLPLEGIVRICKSNSYYHQVCLNSQKLRGLIPQKVYERNIRDPLFITRLILNNKVEFISFLIDNDGVTTLRLCEEFNKLSDDQIIKMDNRMFFFLFDILRTKKTYSIVFKIERSCQIVPNILSLALADNNLERISYLLKYRIDNREDQKKAILIAIKNNQPEILNSLLKYSSEISDEYIHFASKDVNLSSILLDYLNRQELGIFLIELIKSAHNKIKKGFDLFEVENSYLFLFLKILDLGVDPTKEMTIKSLYPNKNIFVYHSYKNYIPIALVAKYHFNNIFNIMYERIKTFSDHLMISIFHSALIGENINIAESILEVFDIPDAVLRKSLGFTMIKDKLESVKFLTFLINDPNKLISVLIYILNIIPPNWTRNKIKPNKKVMDHLIYTILKSIPIDKLRKIIKNNPSENVLDEY